DDAAGFVQLANRLAIAAFDSINFPPSPPETSRDIPIVKPEPENKEDVTLVKVLLPDAGDGWCEQGTAILEVHYSNEKDRQDCWHTIGLPDLRNRRLEIVSGALIDGVRYAWSDNPGRLATFRVGSGFSNRDIINLPGFLEKLEKSDDDVSKYLS